MSFIYSSIKRVYKLPILPQVLKNGKNLEAGKSIFAAHRKFLSPFEESLAAARVCKENKLLVSCLQPSSIIMPTIERNKGIEITIPFKKPLIEEPFLEILEKFDPVTPIVIEEPPSMVIKKEAARLISIRRIKMNKHKLRKLRKRMRFVYRKKNQKREYLKEKEFQASQMDKIREAHAFNAVAYVDDILKRAKEIPFPRTYKGKRLPKEVIRILIENDGKYIPPKPSS
ncbi:UNVERIFIED_CONTAM: hypothetical protein RMT77_000714 [Armadillidium vulgare]